MTRWLPLLLLFLASPAWAEVLVPNDADSTTIAASNDGGTPFFCSTTLCETFVDDTPQGGGDGEWVSFLTSSSQFEFVFPTPAGDPDTGTDLNKIFGELSCDQSGSEVCSGDSPTIDIWITCNGTQTTKLVDNLAITGANQDFSYLFTFPGACASDGSDLGVEFADSVLDGSSRPALENVGWDVAEQAIDGGAGVGSVYIARAPSTNLITNMTSGTHTLVFDTEVVTSSDITRQSGETAFRIQNTGRYLIIANLSMNYADIGNNNRHTVTTDLQLGGAAIKGGIVTQYGRDQSNPQADEGNAHSVVYVAHTALGTSADDITVDAANWGDDTVSLADQFADQSGIQIVRMPDSSDWLQVQRTTDITVSGTLDYGTGDPTWTGISWNSQVVETDTAVIEWTSGTSVVLKEQGHYLVIYNARQDCLGDGRMSVTYRATLDNVDIPASRVASYCRDLDNGNDEYVVTWAGFIETDSTSESLEVDWGPGSQSIAGEITEATLTVVRMSDTASYVRAYHDANRSGETTGDFPMDAEDEDDENIHSTVSNTGRLNGTADDYNWLFFFSTWGRTAANNGNRVGERWAWERTGVAQTWGGFLSFSRGNSGPTHGRLGAFVAMALGSSEYMTLDLTQEAVTGDMDRDFIANRVGASGVALNTLVPAASDRRVIIVSQKDLP